MATISKRGGRREGAGRKANPAKDLRIAQATAQRLLAELGYEKELLELYRKCGDARLKLQILFRLDERAWGTLRAREKLNQEQAEPVKFLVKIERIGA